MLDEELHPTGGATVELSAGFSPFPVRGVIEGFYGRPWRHHDRLRTLEFMARHDLNTYVYAPKNDPLQRARWREPYPERGGGVTLQRFRALIEEAHRRGIAFIASISPGQTLVHSDPEERALLITKLGQILRLGADGVMLSFDDISSSLTKADQVAYGDRIGLAQVEVANAVLTELRGEGHNPIFLFTPTEYWGAASTPYATALQDLDPTVQVVWTGPDVVSSTITPQDADAYARVIGRPPLIWDNFPVNDWCADRLVLRALTGRPADLAGHVQGVLANPMVQCRASWICLSTVADYLEDPKNYEPDTALKKAILEAVGANPKMAEAVEDLAQYCKAFYREDADSPTLRTILAELKMQGRTLQPNSVRALEHELDVLDRAGSQLLATSPDPLMGEMRPWALAACHEAEAGRRALALVRTPFPTPTTHLVAVRRALSGLRRAKHACARDAVQNVCEWALDLRDDRLRSTSTMVG